MIWVFIFCELQFVAILFLLLFAQKRNNLNKHDAPPLTADDEHELELQKERAKAINKDFQKLMAYNVEQALESEKVM